MKIALMLTATGLLSPLPGTGAAADEMPTGPAPITAAATQGASITMTGVDQTATLGYALLPARFRHRAAPTALADARLLRAAGPGLRAVDYADRAALITRLKELDGLRLLTFWETRAFAVFLGVSRDGIAGLNIARKNERTADQEEEEEANPAGQVPEPAFLAATAYRR